MCLSNVTTSEPLIAEEDITVYKIIEKTAIIVDNWKDLVNHGDECIATITIINDETVNGKISIDSSCELYICTNNSRIKGRPAEDMLGYKYSWFFDNNVTSIIVKNKEISKEGYRTIPKGSKYFIGDFKGIENSIASDTLKYVKIIN